MSGYTGRLDVGTLLPPEVWAATDDFKRAAAVVKSLPDGDLIADVLGLNLRPVRGSSSR